LKEKGGETGRSFLPEEKKKTRNAGERRKNPEKKKKRARKRGGTSTPGGQTVTVEGKKKKGVFCIGSKRDKVEAAGKAGKSRGDKGGNEHLSKRGRGCRSRTSRKKGKVD